MASNASPDRPKDGVAAASPGYEAALALLEARQETRWELGLDRVRRLLSRLGDPQDAVPAIHVAGTNGKGTVCMLLAQILHEAGLRPGLTTSPHLAEPTERIRLGPEPVSREGFAALLERVAEAEGEEESTYFELLTAAAFLHFREAGARSAVVEVGLGGRLDATNVLSRPALTVITSIGLDHVQHLGGTLAEIAGEKAGILKPGVPCVVGRLPEEALAVVRARAAAVGAPLLEDIPALRAVSSDWERSRQSLEDASGRVIELGMLGRVAAENAALALACVGALRRRGWAISEGALARGLAGARWPCRFEPLRRGSRTLVLDGAHNLDAMRAFCETWLASPWEADGLAIVGVLEDKDWRSMAAPLAGAFRRAIAVAPDSPRALAPERLAEALRAAGCRADAAPSLERALALFDASDARAGAVCGSFYLAGRVRR